MRSIAPNHEPQQKRRAIAATYLRTAMLKAKETSENDGTATVIPFWRSQLLKSANGVIQGSLANVLTALRSAPEWVDLLHFDEFHQRPVLRGAPPWRPSETTVEEWTDLHDIRCTDWMQHQGIKIHTDVVGQAIALVASERTFHPVRDYLDSLQWDQVFRIGSWASDYLGVPFSPYAARVPKAWMVSAVARIMEPGCKADCALILEGEQGSRKSSALKVLGGPWFSDDIADLGTKDSALSMAGAWIIELAELDAMTRGDISKIKAFMSRSVDRFRPPYGRRVVEQARQCVFAGSVNHAEYLRDETGGRRFWPMKTGLIEIRRLEEDRDQLWAEAVELYYQGAPWWIVDDEIKSSATEEQKQRLHADPWDALIVDFIDNAMGDITVQRVLSEAIQMPKDRWGQAEMNRVSRVLCSHSMERTRVRRNQKLVWIYRNIGESSLFDAKGS